MSLASSNVSIMKVEYTKVLHFAVKPDATAKTVFIASMMHAQTQHPMLNEKPDVTCPSDVQDSERRKEVVHHEEVPGQPKSRQKSSGDTKSNFTIKAKGIPLTLKTVAASTGSMREKWKETLVIVHLRRD